jgi:hypothetical protein
VKGIDKLWRNALKAARHGRGKNQCLTGARHCARDPLPPADTTFAHRTRTGSPRSVLRAQHKDGCAWAALERERKVE